jgi:hypothetical protein
MFDAICMYVAFDVLLGMIYKLVYVLFVAAGIRRQFVCEYLRVALDMRFDVVLQGLLAAIL